MLLCVSATTFIREMTSGRTCPILCGCSDLVGASAGEFVVKLLGQPFQGSGDGPLLEFVASCIAQHFDILVPEPAAVEMTSEFVRLVAASRPRLSSALVKSVGICFGTRVVGPIMQWPIGKAIPEAMLGAATTIFAFDALIKNPDRKTYNPNLATKGDDVYVFDHECAFSFLQAIGEPSFAWNLECERYLQEHVFYKRLKGKQLDLAKFQAALHTLTDTVLTEIRGEVPDVWLTEKFERIAKHLVNIREHEGEFIEQLRRTLI
jgi:hypothetical protein